MTTGLSYFFQASEKYKFNSLITWFSDFEISFEDILIENTPVPYINFSTYYSYYHSEIENVVSTSNLDFNHYSPYALIYVPAGIMVNNL